jgi:tRNA(Ile)-lysidine synthase
MPGAALPRPPAVARVLREVTATARRHGMFDPGTRVLAAVSGGPDSLCLLHSLVRLRRLLRIHVSCFHFDHRLRPGSDRDAAYVGGQARRLGVPIVVRIASSRPGHGESVEAWARVERYRALAAAMDEVEAQVAATGHTVDDQAETVLMGMLRGGGLQALAGMAPVTPPAPEPGSFGIRLARPLLETAREETLAFCRALRLRPRRDPMNEDPSYMRVAIRDRILPLLEERLGRTVRGSIVRTAGLVREDADLLERLADDAARSALEREGGEVRVLATALNTLPLPLAGRVAHRAMLWMGANPEASHVEGLLSLAAGRPGRRLSFPQGLIARRDREYVRLSRPSPGAPA